MSQAEKIQPILQPNKDDMRAHLEFMFKDMGEYADCFIELAWTPPDIGAVTQSERFTQGDIEAAAEKAAKINSVAGQNMYVVSSLLDPDCRPTGRAHDEDAYATPCGWVDIDDGYTPEQLKKIYADLKPSIVVVTGRIPNIRTQMWFKYYEPQTDHDTIREVNEGLIAAFKGDRACPNPARPMRLAGSIAWPKKAGRKPELTELRRVDGAKAVTPELLMGKYPASGYAAHGNDSVGVVEAIELPAFGDAAITDNRDKYMSDMVYASIIALAGKLSRWPTPDEVFSDSWPVYSRKVGTKDGKTLEQANRGSRLMRQKIESKLRNFASGRMRGAPSLERIIAERPKPQIVSHETTDRETGEVKPFKITDWIASARYTGTAKPIRWLVEGIIPQGVPALLAAMGGLGKSFLALDMCIKIATPDNGILPEQLFGKDIREHGRAVLITAEDSFDSIHRRINKLVTPEKLRATSDNLIVIPMCEVDIVQLLVTEGRNGLEMTPFFEELKKQLMDIKDLKLVAIDPLQAFVGADITSKPEAAQFMWSAFAKIASQTGCTFMATHHMRKDGTSEIRTAADAREGIRGVTTLVDGARLAYVLWQVVPEIGRAIASKIGKDYEPHRFIQGAVVKANDEHSSEIMTFYREESGILTACGVIETTTRESTGKMVPVQKEVYESVVTACIDRGSPQIPRTGMKLVRCITYQHLYEELENRGHREFVLKEEDQNDPVKKRIAVKNHTTNARAALKKMGKIDYTKDRIWLVGNESISELENED